MQTTLKDDRHFPRHPTAFIGVTLHCRAWSRQNAICESVLRNRYTVVEAGHGVGKSVIAGALACWWLTTRKPAVVITLAPTWSQVSGIIWRHIRGFHAVASLPGEVFESPRWRISSDRFAMGLSPRKNTIADVQSLQGFHGPNLLVIMDEGALLPPVFWEAATSLVTGEEDRMLVLGNPLAQQGPFWRACQSPNWSHLTISCFDHPNVKQGKDIVPGAVTRTWVEERIAEWAVACSPDTPDAFQIPYAPDRWILPEPIFYSRVIGIAPTEAVDQLIKVIWVSEAQQAWAETEPAPDEIVVLGLDPARFGSAKSAMVCRRGPKVLFVRYRSDRDSIQLATWLLEVSLEVGAERCYIDSIGIGAGVVDQARALGLEVVAVNFAEQAQQSDRFSNKRAECWWRLRTAISSGLLAIPPLEHMLSADLQSVKYQTKKNIVLESKEEVVRRLGRSPDAGDALALTFADRSQASRPMEIEKDRSRWTAATASMTKTNRWRRGPGPQQES